jgi:hypothetical protein
MTNLNCLINRIYYSIKPILPRKLQLALRRKVIMRKLGKYTNVWPIAPQSAKPPEGWQGWPEGARFALILTHDIDTLRGQGRCMQLAEMEKNLGFRSSFNFVPERYSVSSEIRKELVNQGFEVGVHGLYHDGKYFVSREAFRRRALKINRYLKDWNAVGYRSPSMQYNLEWFHDLNIEYDCSTFDTDPFEPQPQGVGTIFPFRVTANSNNGSYIEIPYTLSQDFTLFVLMRERNIDIWKRKLDWIVEHGGLALFNTHPDYMNFTKRKTLNEEYPAEYYKAILEHIKSKYEGLYWHVLPRDMAHFWRKRTS